jgi:hypothetical protein
LKLLTLARLVEKATRGSATCSSTPTRTRTPERREREGGYDLAQMVEDRAVSDRTVPQGPNLNDQTAAAVLGRIVPACWDPFAARRVGYVLSGRTQIEPEIRYAMLTPVAAVGTGVVVIVVAIAVVMVVMLVTLSMRGRQRRVGKHRQELADARERAARAERDRDIAQEQSQRSDSDS